MRKRGRTIIFVDRGDDVRLRFHAAIDGETNDIEVNVLNRLCQCFRQSLCSLARLLCPDSMMCPLRPCFIYSTSDLRSVTERSGHCRDGLASDDFVQGHESRSTSRVGRHGGRFLR